jgi:hypothetical protein
MDVHMNDVMTDLLRIVGSRADEVLGLVCNLANSCPICGRRLLYSTLLYWVIGLSADDAREAVVWEYVEQEYRIHSKRD